MLRIIFTADDVLQHGPPTLAKSVCRHARQFYVRVFQHLLDSTTDARSFLGETRPHSRQVAQIADHFAGYITGPQKTVLQQLRNPFRILLVGLATRHILDVLRVRQNYRELLSPECSKLASSKPRWIPSLLESHRTAVAIRQVHADLGSSHRNDVGVSALVPLLAAKCKQKSSSYVHPNRNISHAARP